MFSEIAKIPIADIRVCDNQRPIVPDKLDAITKSIKEIGLKTPITVRRRKNRLNLISGHHRLKAMKSLGSGKHNWLDPRLIKDQP